MYGTSKALASLEAHVRDESQSQSIDSVDLLILAVG